MSTNPSVYAILLLFNDFIVSQCLIYFPFLAAPQEIDKSELIDPVDILTPLEKSGFWEGVKATM
ncbi:hypothetical protein Patl1_20889 [Pistacia atlantica]|uniref:Uncharacterized protein n=1 Tax=Pistacia atlantica TaxID=434234 RepID=A0ACC1BMK2_9ROSI|nr:hypothetical protein Patl1_20889 [Pistacia atlantica]